MNIITENIPMIIEVIKNQYEKDVWDFFNTHPNLVGPASRAMINIYIENKKHRTTDSDILRAVIYNRRIAGGLINYAGGDKLKELDETKINLLTDYAENDFCVIIYALMYMESEIFRMGVAEDESTNEIICDVIFINMLETLKGGGMTIKRNEILDKISNFKKDWYNLHFGENLYESYLQETNLSLLQYQSAMTPWILCNMKTKTNYNDLLTILNENNIKFTEEGGQIKFYDKIKFIDFNGDEKNIWLTVKILKGTVSQTIDDPMNGFCEDFYSCLKFLPFATKKLINSKEYYLIANSNVLISYSKYGYNPETMRPNEFIYLQYNNPE